MNRLSNYLKPIEDIKETQNIDAISIFSFLVVNFAQEKPDIIAIDELSQSFCNLW